MSNNTEIANTMRALASNQSSPPRQSLVVDKDTKRLRAVPTDSQMARNNMTITPSDLRVSGTPVVVCAGDQIESALGADSPLLHQFRISDDAVYNGIGSESAQLTVPGVIRKYGTECPGGVTVDIVVDLRTEGAQDIHGRVHLGSGWVDCELQVVPVREALFSRFRGLLETDDVAGKTVMIVALGSVGSPILSYLVKSGVTNLILVDPERLEVPNVVRHVAGIESIGRKKVDWARDYVLSKNPYAHVETLDIRVEADTIPQISAALKRCDIAVCTIDNRQGKQLFTRLAVQAGVTHITAGAFTRAHGAGVLRCIPGVTPCYQCFLDALPEYDRDQEVSDLEQARAMGIHYADRPAPIQPGLALDIEPPAHLAAKLVLQELLKGKDTPLNSLNEDLSAHWYLWLNRREPGTDYEQLEPLGCYVDGIRILRWLGVDFERNEHCPVCGNGLEAMAQAHGITFNGA